MSDLVIITPPYRAPLRDHKDLHVVQTAERGEANVLCSNDADFYAPALVEYCASRGTGVYKEASLLDLLVHGK